MTAKIEELTSDRLLVKLHEMIDIKFNRKNRSKLIAPPELKARMSLVAITREFFEEYSPDLIAVLMMKLIANGSVVSNIGEEGIYPTDAYFIPKTEMMDEEAYRIYSSVKNRIQ